MYAKHARMIQDHVRDNGAPAFREVCVFVLATIRVPLWQAVTATRAILTSSPDADDALRRVIWGAKRQGMAFLDDADAVEHLYLEADAYARAGEVAALLEVLTRIPGIGLAKAGFVAQLAWGASGCLDSHNLKRWGLSPNLCTIGASKRRETRLRRAHAYQVVVGSHGGTEHLWDSWCNYVAENQPKRYTDGHHVSELHAVALGLV